MKKFKLTFAHIVLIAGSLLFLIPFAWLISTSLKTDEEQAVFPPVWIPTQQVTTDKYKNAEGKPAGLSWLKSPGSMKEKVAEVEELPDGRVRVQSLDKAGLTQVVTREDLEKIRHTAPRWENYSEALDYLPPETYYGLVFLGNTLLLTFLSVTGTLLSSSLVAYSFARLRWPGRNLLFVILLATMMIPGAVTMMPQFLIFRELGWIDTLKPLWVPAFFGSAFNIFLLRQFFMSIPNELEDAAKIDGCSPFGTYWRVMLPQVRPAMAAIAIMGVLGGWNNFQGPLIYLSSAEKMPLAYALQLYQQQHGGEPGLLMAASTLVVLPIIVLFFFTQRYFIEGVSLTGLGGR
jgi:multiple sugar transport system permease protein